MEGGDTRLMILPRSQEREHLHFKGPDSFWDTFHLFQGDQRTEYKSWPYLWPELPLADHAPISRARLFYLHLYNEVLVFQKPFPPL